MKMKCEICNGDRLAVKKDPKSENFICKTMKSCADGTGFKDEYRGSCVGCPYQGCKTCDLGVEGGGCTECIKDGWKAIDFTESPYLKEGEPNYGEKKCVDPALVPNVDGFFIEENNFKRCLENCKTCSDGLTCAECLPPPGSAEKLYLVKTTSPHRCTGCLIANNEYLTDSNQPECVVCPENQRLMKGGTGKDDCGPCLKASAKFVDNAGYCNSCLAQCSECDNQSGCTRCLDENHNLQPDGKCQAGCPRNYKADAHKVCKEMSCKVEGCSECSDHDVCSKCRGPKNLQPNNSCQKGCPINYKADQDQVCQQLSCKIKDCLECSEDNICSNCRPGMNLQPSNSCQKGCPKKFKPDQNSKCREIICKINNCKECSDDQVCSECQPPTNLHPSNECKEGCPPNYKADSERKCQKLNCDILGCVECSDHNICSKCQNQKLIQPDGTCQEGCPPNFKPNAGKRCIALACDLSSCVECSRDEVCSKCSEGFTLSSGKCIETHASLDSPKVQFLDYELIQQFSVDEFSDFTLLMVLDLEMYSLTQAKMIRSSLTLLPISEFEIRIYAENQENEDKMSPLSLIPQKNLKILQNTIKSSKDIYFSFNLTEEQNSIKEYKYLSFRHERVEIKTIDDKNRYFLPKSQPLSTKSTTTEIERTTLSATMFTLYPKR